MTAQEYVNGLFELTGHVGIITGASRGIGLGEAEALYKKRIKKKVFQALNVSIRLYVMLRSMMNWKIRLKK